MYKIQLKDSYSNTVTIYFSNSLTVYPRSDGKYTVIMDGLHNNGGWLIPSEYHTYDEIIEKIDNAIQYWVEYNDKIRRHGS